MGLMRAYRVIAAVSIEQKQTIEARELLATTQTLFTLAQLVRWLERGQTTVEWAEHRSSCGDSQ